MTLKGGGGNKQTKLLYGGQGSLKKLKFQSRLKK